MHPGSQEKRKLPEGEGQGWQLLERGRVCREAQATRSRALEATGKQITVFGRKPTMAPVA